MASLYFKYSAMNSGKSTQLLQAHYNYQERGMSPLAITANIDDRYGTGKITARIGLDLEADTFTSNTDIFQLAQDKMKQNPINAVLVDEAQFMTEEQVKQCARIVDEIGIPVMAYGLRTDFLGKFFPGSEALMRMADNIEEIKTICWCGRKATHTARLDEAGQVVTEGDQISIGGNDSYISLCRKHHTQGKASDTIQSADKAA